MNTIRLEPRSADNALDERFHADLKETSDRELAQRSRAAIFSYPLLLCITLAPSPFFHDHPAIVLTLIALTLLIAAARASISFPVKKLYASNPVLWKRLFAIGLYAAGFAWGIYCSLNFMLYGTATSSMVLVAVTCALAAASTTSLAPDQSLSRQYSVLILFPMFAWGCMQGSIEVFAIALCVVVYELFLMYEIKMHNTAYWENITYSQRLRLQAVELEKARQLAEQANEAKSRFLATMSHEIRTPMNGVVGFADMMLETELTEDQRDYAYTIQRSAEALLSLINDILDFSKIEAGKIDLEELDFDIEMLAYDVCELIRPRIKTDHVQILCRIDDSLPARIKGDPHRFRQVLVNLLGNAAKFTEKGEIELGLAVQEQHNDSIMIHAQVRDTGIGIPHDRIESVFKAFEQVDSSIGRRFGGTGLGLAICCRIAELMGGAVWAESTLGKGSIFHFTALMRPSEEKRFKRIVPVSLAGKKVLVTDDNTSNLEILRHSLESVGMRMHGCVSADDALRTLHETFRGGDTIDICVVDIKMPALDGYALAKTIRKNYGNALPLLAFSSSVVKGVAHQCQEVGFDGFLPKPINRIKLFNMMERLLGETATQNQQNREPKLITQHSIREDAKHSVSILLAEDNPVNQKLAFMLLTKAGYSVDIADNGRAAVDKLTAAPDRYDLIFMDVQMPECTGIDATKAIRSLEENRRSSLADRGSTEAGPATGSEQRMSNNERRIPIIAMTADAMKGDREKCIEAGMDDYIAKPIKREAVFEMISKWVLEKSAKHQEGA